MTSPRLQGRVAVVTGAASGIGRAITVQLAGEGALVIAADVNGPRLQETAALAAEGGKTVTVLGDLRDPIILRRIVAAADEQGGADILVNNAGVMDWFLPAADVDDETWDRLMDINAKAPMRLMRAMIPTMEDRGRGAIVNIASTSGVRFTGAFQVGYAATKAGVIQLSRVVAVQYAGKGIRVNTVVPGQLHTPMVEARLAKQRAGGDVDALLAQRQKRIPIGFMGDGRDTANAALFLASDEARFVTGTELVVDGGMIARCD